MGCLTRTGRAVPVLSSAGGGLVLAGEWERIKFALGGSSAGRLFPLIPAQY